VKSECVYVCMYGVCDGVCPYKTNSAHTHSLAREAFLAPLSDTLNARTRRPFDPLSVITHALAIESKHEAAKKAAAPKISPEASRLNHLFGSRVAAKVINLFDKMKKSGVSTQVLGSNAHSGKVLGADSAIKAMQAVAQDGDSNDDLSGGKSLQSSKDLAAENDLKMFQEKKAESIPASGKHATMPDSAFGGLVSDKDQIAMRDLEKMQKAGLLAHSKSASTEDDGVPPTTNAERNIGGKLPRLMQHLFGSKVATKYTTLKQQEAKSTPVCACM
jgi:hypothetical protein